RRGPGLRALARRGGQPAQPGRDPALGGAFRGHGAAAQALPAAALGRGRARGRRPRRSRATGAHATRGQCHRPAARRGLHPGRDRGARRRRRLRRHPAAAAGLRARQRGRRHVVRAGRSLRPAPVDSRHGRGGEPQRGRGHRRAAGALVQPVIRAADAAGGGALPWAARILAALYMGAGGAAMWLLAPRVPYADAWRHLARFVATPFPGDILRPDNGHHEVLPNIVRVLELRLFDGGQTLQIATGIMLALATLLAYWRGVRGLDDPRRRLAALLAAAVALFWLGNVRALAHGNESVHAYLVTLCLALGLHALVRSRGPAA